jgi:hypothetical protein
MQSVSQSLTDLFSSKNLYFNPFFSEFRKKLSLGESNLKKKWKKEKFGSVFIIGAILSDLFNSKCFSKEIFEKILKFLFETENLTYENVLQTIEIFFLCDNLSSEEKKILQMFQDFLTCPTEKKKFLSESPCLWQAEKDAFSVEGEKRKKKKIFYFYRITYSPSEPNTGHKEKRTKKYYSGYRGTFLSPFQDTAYWSSSKVIQNLRKTSEKDCFTKKILGIFLFEKDALEAEVSYHRFFDVKNHPKFLNQANQTSQKFCYDNTGRVQTLEANKKRSKKLKGKILSHSTREKIKLAQLTRERSEEETKNRSKNMKIVSQMRKECPHCQKQVPCSAGKRWHFDNCLQNPNFTPERRKELELEREVLQQNAIARNKKNAVKNK